MKHLPVRQQSVLTTLVKQKAIPEVKVFDFSVTLSSASANTVQVKYKTVDVTAAGGVDYVAVPNKTQVTFNPGETVKTVNISVNGDVDIEANESFKVKLSDAVNATILDNTGKGTIRNDDGPLATIMQTARMQYLCKNKRLNISKPGNGQIDDFNTGL